MANKRYLILDICQAIHEMKEEYLNEHYSVSMVATNTVSKLRIESARVDINSEVLIIVNYYLSEFDKILPEYADMFVSTKKFRDLYSHLQD